MESVPNIDDEARAAVAACEAIGALELSAAEMIQDRGFYEGAIVRPYLDAIQAALDLDEDRIPWDAGGDLLRRLVTLHLLPVLAEQGTVVEVRHLSKNPARVWMVNGLSHNDDAVPYSRVSVPSGEVAAAALLVLSGEPLPAAAPYVRPSVLEVGLPALVGRVVDVLVSGEPEEPLRGKLLAAFQDGLVLALDGHDGDGRVGFIPLGVVRMVSTDQLTASEDAAVWPEDN